MDATSKASFVSVVAASSGSNTTTAATIALLATTATATATTTNASSSIAIEAQANADADQSGDNPFYPTAQMQLLMCALYGLLAFFAVASNVVVCRIVLEMRAATKSATNYFIVNLAVGDILMALLCIPFTFVSNLIYGYWPFGLPLCVTVSFSQAVSVFVSVYTMVAISIDKYIAIIHPLRPRMSKAAAKSIICGIWIAALTTSLPTALLTQLKPASFYQNNNENLICQEIWPQFWPNARYYYSMALMVLQFVVPLFVLVATYARIVAVIWFNKTPGEEDNARDAQLARSKRKMVKMVMFCVIAFALTWLPFNALIVVGDYYHSIWTLPQINYVWFVTHYLAMCHTITNPIIYVWMNKRFRLGFKQVGVECLQLISRMRALILKALKYIFVDCLCVCCASKFLSTSTSTSTTANATATTTSASTTTTTKAQCSPNKKTNTKSIVKQYKKQQTLAATATTTTTTAAAAATTTGRDFSSSLKKAKAATSNFRLVIDDDDDDNNDDDDDDDEDDDDEMTTAQLSNQNCDFEVAQTKRHNNNNNNFNCVVRDSFSAL